MNWPNI